MARFIIVDDSRPMRDQIHRILRDAGHEVVAQGKNGEEALELVEKHQPDAITLDINMPVMGGDVAANALLTQGSHPIIFIVSSVGQESVYQPLLDRGCAGFISKPYQTATLVKAIARGLNGRP